MDFLLAERREPSGVTGPEGSRLPLKSQYGN